MNQHLQQDNYYTALHQPSQLPQSSTSTSTSTPSPSPSPSSTLSSFLSNLHTTIQENKHNMQNDRQDKHLFLSTEKKEFVNNKQVVKTGFELLDLVIYYLINLMLVLLNFCDLVVDSIKGVVFKYEIIVCALKNGLYKNIN